MVRNCSPSELGTPAPIATNPYFEITDDVAGVNQASLDVSVKRGNNEDEDAIVDGEFKPSYSGTIVPNAGHGYDITINPDADFGYGQMVNVCLI